MNGATVNWSVLLALALVTIGLYYISTITTSPFTFGTVAIVAGVGLLLFF
jgi:hypothetical protein